MTLMSVFIFFVFSTLGLGLLYLTQAYLKMSANKKNITFMDFSSENGVKQGFGRLAGLISANYSPAILSEDSYQELRENARGGGLRAVEEALGINFPVETRETWGGQAWSCSTQFTQSRFMEDESYFLTDNRGEIESEGSLKNAVWKRRSSCELSLKNLAGYIPLAYFPLLITQNLDSSRISNLKESQNLVFLPFPTNQIFPQISASGLPLIPDDPGLLLNRALNIKIFSPEKLSTAELRAALGLEPASSPIPDGVYLIKNDLGLGGVYVHGDVDEMVLAVESGFQVISFRLDAETWVLKYSPEQSRTQFSSPEGILSYDLVPLGIVMVNGRINSLGGGLLDSLGQAVLVRNEEIPSILRGVSLTIVSSDRVALSSSLIHQGLKWQNGIPYVKDQTSQLIVYSTGRDFWSDEDKEGEIIIDANAPQDMKIQATITARDGFSIEGGRKTALLIGGLQTSDLKTNDNILKIAPDERLLSHGLRPQNSPVTAVPLLFILGLRAVQWNEY
jgi:hypothetical protein